MLCRAKISSLFVLVGTLTAAGALPNLERRNATFQPGGRTLGAQPEVLRPATATIHAKRWAGVRVQTINPAAATLVRVELSGVKLAKAGDARVAPGMIGKAGGGK